VKSGESNFGNDQILITARFDAGSAAGEGQRSHTGQLARRSRFEPRVKKRDCVARNLVELGGDSGVNCVRTGRRYEFHLLQYRHLHGARCGAAVGGVVFISERSPKVAPKVFGATLG
jgi:hypothetical protein